MFKETKVAIIRSYYANMNCTIYKNMIIHK